MDIKALKSQLEITHIAEQLGIRVGKNDKSLCPFHNDKSPSLQFSRDKQIATCFSSNCNAGTMDVVELVKRKENWDLPQTLKWLEEQAGIYPSKQAEVKSEIKKEVSALSSQVATQITESERIEILSHLFQLFEKSFIASSTAKSYAESRNINTSSISIGYNTGNFHQSIYLKEDREVMLKKYIALGLLSTGHIGYKAFGKGCLVFPLKNENGQIVSLYFRETDPNKSTKHYYLKNRQGLYPGYPKKNTQTLILTESIIDTITLSQYSLPNTRYSLPNTRYSLLSSYGTEGSKEQLQSILGLRELKEVIIFFDGDIPGRQGAEKLAGQLQLQHKQLQIKIVNTPDGEDINSLVQSHDPAILSHLIEASEPFFFSKETPQEIEVLLPEINNNGGQSSADTEATRSEVSGLIGGQSSVDCGQNSGQSSVDCGLKSGQLSVDCGQKSGLNTSNPNNLLYTTETASYQIKGGIRKDLDSLKVTLVIEHLEYKTKSRNKLDLYEDKQTEKISREASEKLHLRADLIEQDLHILTDLLDEYREETTPLSEEKSKAMIISKEEKEKCYSFLKKPNLLQNINHLIGKSGVVGEEKNRLFLFGIASTYKMENTLHALIQGTSGSGKTHLLATIMDFMPPEDTIHLTRVTESSFYNYGQYELSNKLIGMEDFDGLEEKAELAFRELMSKGMISSSTSGKNEHTGQIAAYIKTVFGPIASLSATTKGEIYEDNMSRCFLISVDESAEQTQRIIKYQNDKAAGQIDGKKEKEIRAFLRNCMRLLLPLDVVNPYANKINLPKEAHKIRRLNDLFQSYVKQVTLLSQYQRNKDAQGRLITDKEDVKTAIEIMFDSILLKVDELDGNLRDFYEQLKKYVLSKGKQYEFEQREIRQQFRVSKTQMHRHIGNLLELEYIIKTYVSSRNTFHYKIAYWDNMEALRNQIKTDLNSQLDKL